MLGSKNAIRKTTEDWIVDAFVAVCLILTFIITFYPFYYVIIMSLNDGIDAQKGGIYFWPRVFTIQNYVTFLNDPQWINGIVISVSKTLLGTATAVLFTCMVGYGMSFPNLAFNKAYNIIMLVCMYFSSGLIPYYLTLNQYGMLNKFVVYIIPAMFSVYNCIIARAFFREMPFELYESATLDGAGDLRIFFKIIIPLALPMVATIALFVAVGQWNSWSDTAFFCPANKSLRSLSYLMRDVITKNQVSNQAQTPGMDMIGSRLKTTVQSIQMAAMIITVLPIVMVYPFVQKYFVKGVMLGAVKG